MSDEPSTLLIFNLLGLADSDENELRCTLPLSAIYIDRGRIIDITNNAERIERLKSQVQILVDGSGKIALPGLINAHCHSYSTVLRGTENSQPLETWAYYTMAFGGCIDPKLMQIAVKLGAAEMIRNGITSVIDHIPHTQHLGVTLSAHKETNMRIGLAPFMQDIPDHEFLNFQLASENQDYLDAWQPPSVDETEHLFNEFFDTLADYPDRLIGMIGPNAPQRCSRELWDLWKRLQEKFDAPVHTHLLETEIQAKKSREKFQGGLVTEMSRAGLLNRQLSVAHAIWLTPEERALLALNDVTVVHNPTSNLMLGSGLLPFHEYRGSGVSVALGSDSANTGGRHDIFEVARLAAMLPRLRTKDYKSWPTTKDVLMGSIKAGAKALGLTRELGALRPGYLADIILIDISNCDIASPALNLEAIAQHASSQNIADVIIDGKMVMNNKTLQTIDEKRVVAEFQDLKLEFIEKSKPATARAKSIEAEVYQLLI